jgi:hypothetical protein
MFGKSNHSWRRFHPLKILFFVAVFIAFVLALGWVVMFLWNAILPDAIGVKPLTFWKAVGLLVLAKILFGGFGRGKGRWGNSSRSHWRNKWKNMSGEEREQMKLKWKARCGRRSEKNEE